MSGSVEVRQFLLRYEGADGGSTSLSGGVPAPRGSSDGRVSDDQVRRARLAVANGALDVEDCAQLLDMLGLSPGEDGQSPVQR
ncbi:MULTISPECIES: hypothetical protein [Amycolatopsis]|uniref:Uncharacterized protein n=2 Tax=Amycolatopsis TaxID=1813 RepID=A0A2A9F948_9PSEU|nr:MULTISPECIES: hypothetical protein [Amycolatopsis]PFG47874.1 hypothetical protein ATK36_2934 [Amycolatopsis sulphurea]RJQ76474.1 hypothetical protein D5S19_30410 [Amycolatopsis panacis]